MLDSNSDKRGDGENHISKILNRERDASREGPPLAAYDDAKDVKEGDKPNEEELDETSVDILETLASHLNLVDDDSTVTADDTDVDTLFNSLPSFLRSKFFEEVENGTLENSNDDGENNDGNNVNNEFNPWWREGLDSSFTAVDSGASDQPFKEVVYGKLRVLMSIGIGIGDSVHLASRAIL